MRDAVPQSGGPRGPTPQGQHRLQRFATFATVCNGVQRFATHSGVPGGRRPPGTPAALPEGAAAPPDPPNWGLQRAQAPVGE
eukprot:4301716-Alexandrium_andersonii.AAC.1